MPVLPGGTIGNWSTTILTKFIEDWFRNKAHPPTDKIEVSALSATGTATAPTPLSGDYSTQVATTAFVVDAIADDIHYFNAKAYGAVGDGVNDDTAAIQRALNAAGALGGAVGNNMGGVVVLGKGRYIIKATLTMPENVALVGQGRGANLSNNPPTILDAGGLAAPIITGNGNASTIQGIALYGKNATGSKGIYMTGGSNWLIRDCVFTGFGDQALHITAGVSHRIENCLATNSLLVRTGRAGYVGVFDIASTDTTMTGCEVSASSTGNQSGNGYICALAQRGDNCFIGPGNQFEISETGVYVDSAIVSGAGVTFIGCRADLNYCTGWFIQGSFCTFVGCWAWRNSQSLGNSYDGFEVNGGNTNTFVGCRVGNLGPGIEKRHRYAFSDFSQDNLWGGGNHAINVQTATFFINNASVGAHPESIFEGVGSPEGVFSAQPGATYRDTNGGAGTTFYVKEIGTALTGWTPIASDKEIGYDQFTSGGVTVTSAVEATGTTVLACAAHVFDGQEVELEFFSPWSQPAAGGFMVISLFEGATQIGRLAWTNSNHPVTSKLRFQPSAGSHTYTITAMQGGGNGVLWGQAGGTGNFLPMYARFTKV